MEIVVVALAIVTFLVLLVPASLLPLLAGAALGADTIDPPDRAAQFDGIADVWDDDGPIAA